MTVKMTIKLARQTLDVITLEEAGSLFGLFQERVRRTPDAVAYRHFDNKTHQWQEFTWQETANRVAAIQAALSKEGLQRGDRVAIMLRNCPSWVFFEQAALGLGLVVVPLYTNDRADNVAYVLQDAGVRILLVEDDSTLKQLDSITPQLQGLERLVSVVPCGRKDDFPRITSLDEWTVDNSTALQSIELDPFALATIVYTSGTTGRPKGVMLSHRNILFNVDAALKAFPIYREDLLLSFLPLSHMLERTLGYYIPMMCGSTVAYARSVQELAADLLSQKPTILISVPRIYERVYNKIFAQLEHKSSLAQKLFHSAVEAGWRRANGRSSLLWPLLKALVAKKIMAKLGGRMRLAICGGAPISPDVAKTFIGLGLNLITGYGLTETSPIISGNPENNNEPASVGVPLPGVEVKIGDHDELLTRSPSVMLGYWQNTEATQAVMTGDGWFHTGDKVRIEDNHIYIVGRLKEIIVLSNGEKVSPADMELAITMDTLFEQALVFGEGRPFLSAFVVIDTEIWKTEAVRYRFDLDDEDVLKSKAVRRFVLDRIAEQVKDFPGYAQIRAVTILDNPWCIEDGTMTPTLKLKRSVIEERCKKAIAEMYKGH